MGHACNLEQQVATAGPGEDINYQKSSPRSPSGGYASGRIGFPHPSELPPNSPSEVEVGFQPTPVRWVARRMSVGFPSRKAVTAAITDLLKTGSREGRPHVFPVRLLQRLQHLFHITLGRSSISLKTPINFFPDYLNLLGSFPDVVRYNLFSVIPFFDATQ